MGKLFKKIWETIEGKNGVGKALHTALPLKKLRSAFGSVVLGIKKASPLPEFKDAAVRESVTSADKTLQGLEITAGELGTSKGVYIFEKIREVRDVLDDGKMNDSADDLSPKAKKTIQQSISALPVVAYIYYVISTGNFSVGGFIEYLQLLF